MKNLSGRKRRGGVVGLEEIHAGDTVRMTDPTGVRGYDNLTWEVLSEPWDLFGTKAVRLAAYPGGPYPVRYLKRVTDRQK